MMLKCPESRETLKKQHLCNVPQKQYERTTKNIPRVQINGSLMRKMCLSVLEPHASFIHNVVI